MAKAAILVQMRFTSAEYRQLEKLAKDCGHKSVPAMCKAEMQVILTRVQMTERDRKQNRRG